MWPAGMQIYWNKSIFQEKISTFENGGFSLKTYQMLSVHTTPKEFKQVTITDLCLWKTRLEKSRDYPDTIVFEKLTPSSKCFPSSRKQKADVFKFLRFKVRFRKAPFSVDGRPNRRNKAAFSNFSVLVWTFLHFTKNYSSESCGWKVWLLSIWRLLKLKIKRNFDNKLPMHASFNSAESFSFTAF